MPIPGRRSVRLRTADYGAPGLYFVTVCTAGRRPLFGRIQNGQMRLSAAGRMARDEWLRTGVVRPSVVIDAFVVMPDHVHLLVGIVDAGRDADADRDIGHDAGGNAVAPIHAVATRRVAPTDCQRVDVESPNGPPTGSIGAIVGQYKSMVTRQIWAAAGRDVGPVWQRSFHDRIVRTPYEAEHVRRYIAENPMRWTAGH